MLALAGSSFALSLGGVRGTAVLGQTLSLAFELKLDSGEDVDAGCLRAQLTQGDTVIDGSRVTLAISGSAGDRVVRLRSSVAVDEPMVSVTLSSTCGQQVSRRYVLLTDLPQDSRASASASAVTSASVVPLPMVQAPRTIVSEATSASRGRPASSGGREGTAPARPAGAS